MSLSERIIAVVDQAGFSNGLKYYLKTELNKTKNFTINNENDIPLETRQRIAKLLSAKWNKTKITSLSVLVEEALKINIEADSGVVSEVEQVVSEKNPINLQQEIVESKTEESPSIAETDAVQKNPNTPIINISNMQGDQEKLQDKALSVKGGYEELEEELDKQLELIARMKKAIQMTKDNLINAISLSLNEESIIKASNEEPILYDDLESGGVPESIKGYKSLEYIYQSLFDYALFKIGDATLAHELIQYSILRIRTQVSIREFISLNKFLGDILDIVDGRGRDMYNDINQKHKLENIPKSFMINDKKNYISLVKDFTNRIRPALDSIPESNQSRQVLELLYFKKQTWQEISSKFAGSTNGPNVAKHDGLATLQKLLFPPATRETKIKAKVKKINRLDNNINIRFKSISDLYTALYQYVFSRIESAPLSYKIVQDSIPWIWGYMQTSGYPGGEKVLTDILEIVNRGWGKKYEKNVSENEVSSLSKLFEQENYQTLSKDFTDRMTPAKNSLKGPKLQVVDLLYISKISLSKISELLELPEQELKTIRKSAFKKLSNVLFSQKHNDIIIKDPETKKGKEKAVNINFQTISVLYTTLYNYIANRTEDKDIAHDVIQDSMPRIWRYTQSNKYTSRETFIEGIINIVDKRCFKIYKQHDTIRDCEKPSQDFQINNKEDHSCLVEEFSAWIKPALENLSEQDKQIMDLHYMQGLKGQEISDKLNLPKGTPPATIVFNTLKKIKNNLFPRTNTQQDKPNNYNKKSLNDESSEPVHVVNFASPAISDLYETLHEYILTRTGDVARTPELVQGTMLRIWGYLQLHEFTSGEEFLHELLSIINLRLRKDFKIGPTNIDTSRIFALCTAENYQALSKDFSNRISPALSCLKKKSKEVIDLLYTQKVTLPQISQIRRCKNTNLPSVTRDYAFETMQKTLFPGSTQSTKNDRQNTNNPDNIQETDKIQKTVLKTKSPYNKKVIEKHIEDNATEIQKDNPTEVKEIKTHREQECVLHPNTREQMLNSSGTLNTVTTVLPSPDTSYIASDVSTFNTILGENANLPSFTEEDLKGKFQWFLEQYKKILLSSGLDREKLIKLRVKIGLRSTIHEAARKDSLTLYIKFLGEVEKDLIRANC